MTYVDPSEDGLDHTQAWAVTASMANLLSLVVAQQTETLDDDMIQGTVHGLFQGPAPKAAVTVLISGIVGLLSTICDQVAEMRGDCGGAQIALAMLMQAEQTAEIYKIGSEMERGLPE